MVIQSIDISTSSTRESMLESHSALSDIDSTCSIYIRLQHIGLHHSQALETMKVLLVLLLLAVCIYTAQGQQCSDLPSSSFINDATANRHNSRSGEGNSVTVTVSRYNFNCKAVGTIRGEYRRVSYTAEYTVDGGDGTVRYIQACLRCSSAPGTWTISSGSQVYDATDDSAIIAMLLSDPARTNCSACADSSSADVYACIGEDIHQTCTVLHVYTSVYAYKEPLLISNYKT